MSELVRHTPAPPVRHVHLGLGNFFRAHQAWYTAHASDGGEWGIAAFTGRSPDLARAMAAQETGRAHRREVDRHDQILG